MGNLIGMSRFANGVELVREIDGNGVVKCVGFRRVFHLVGLLNNALPGAARVAIQVWPIAWLKAMRQNRRQSASQSHTAQRVLLKCCTPARKGL